MSRSEMLFNEVFEEMTPDMMDVYFGAGLTESEVAAMVPRGVDVCQWLWFCCIHDIVIGTSGGEASQDACVSFSQICGQG